MAQAAHRFGDRAESGPVAIRSGLAVAGQTHHHEPGVLRRQNVIAEPELLQQTRPEIFDDDIGFFRQTPHDLLALFGFQIDRDGFLVARLHGPP